MVNWNKLVLVSTPFRLLNEHPVELIPLFSFSKVGLSREQMFQEPAFFRHCRGVMNTLDVAVSGLDDLGALVPALEKLGKRHKTRNVKTAHFKVFFCLLSVVHGLYVIPFRWFTSPLVLYRGFHSGFSMGLCREPVQGGKLKKSKKRGLIFSVKLQQHYKEKNITTTINCYLNTT